MKTTDLYDFDTTLLKENGARYLVGVDEAGRGPLAGPVVVSAVMLDLDSVIEGINDSKKLSEKKRNTLLPEIEKNAIRITTAVVDEEVIDSVNILKATLLGMQSCVSMFPILNDVLVIVDGNVAIPDLPVLQKSIVKGDSKSATIAAASIKAKTLRDKIMVESSHFYPMFDFGKNKGYPTKEHIETLKQWGISDMHRKSFCKKFFTA